MVWLTYDETYHNTCRMAVTYGWCTSPTRVHMSWFCSHFHIYICYVSLQPYKNLLSHMWPKTTVSPRVSLTFSLLLTEMYNLGMELAPCTKSLHHQSFFLCAAWVNFLEIWKGEEFFACAQCGLWENVTHIWNCQSPRCHWFKLPMWLPMPSLEYLVSWRIAQRVTTPPMYWNVYNLRKPKAGNRC